MAETTFQIELGVAGSATVDSAAASLANLEQRLTAAGSAASQAAEAVKAGEAAYNASQVAADRAAKALEKIGVAAEQQRAKLAALSDAGDTGAAERAALKLQALVERQAEAASKAQEASAAMNEQAASLDRLKTAAGAAAEAEKKISTQLDAQKAAAAKAQTAQQQLAGSAKTNEIAESLGKLGGPMGALGQKAFGAAEGAKKLRDALGTAGPYVAVAAAIVAVAASVAVATVAIAKWAIGLADAARSQSLLAAGIAGTVQGGKELQATLDKLETEVPQTRDELMQMAGDLAKTGLKGAALSKALEDAAIKAAEVKWGPEFGKQTLSLSNQMTRLKSNIGKTFGGLNIEGLLIGFSKLVALFDSTSETGKAMKVVFESMFQPLIDGVTALIPKMVSAFIRFEILALKALIAIKPYGSKIQAIGEALLTVAVVGWTLAGVALTVVAVAIGVVVGMITGVVMAFKWMYEAVVSAGKAMRDFFSTLSLSEVGTNIVTGLATGITSAGPAVLNALKGVVTGAIDSAKKLLKIASPSQVFAEIGSYTAEGMAAGVDAGAPNVQSSLESMVAPPAATASAGGGGAAGGGGHTFQIVVHAPSGDAKDIRAELESMLLRILDGDVAQLAVEVPA